jgi:hypothetical protein
VVPEVIEEAKEPETCPPAEDKEPEVVELPPIESKFSTIKETEQIVEDEVKEPEPCMPPVPEGPDCREAVLMLCNLVKVTQMNTFTDVTQDEMLKCFMFFNSFMVRSREDMCDELMLVFEKSEDVCLQQTNTTYSEMHTILHKISQATMNPPQYMGMMPQMPMMMPQMAQ